MWPSHLAGWDGGGAHLGFVSGSVDAEPGRSAPDPSYVIDCYWSESELHLENETWHVICRGATWLVPRGVGTSFQLYGYWSVLESWFISGDTEEEADEPLCHRPVTASGSFRWSLYGPKFWNLPGEEGGAGVCQLAHRPTLM